MDDQLQQMPTEIISPPSLPRKSNQPKHHAPKTRMLSNLRRRKIIEACLDGRPLKPIAISTGLSPKSAEDQACRILQEPRVIQGFNSILEAEGLSDKFLAQKARTLIDAKQIIYAQKDGIFTDQREVEALETQRKTLELTAKLKGHLKEQSGGDINIGLMQMVVQAVRRGEDED
jgi:hypothetical protein